MKKRFWIAGGLMLVAVIVVLFLLLTGVQEHPATVVEAVNKVDAHPRPKDDWQSAAVGMAIYGGGQVRTGVASLARLELLEGMVRLSAETIFTVKESATRQGTLVTTLFLQEGRLWAQLTSDQPHEFTVETGSAVAAVRDTRFSVRVADGETLLSVAEGEVELTAQEQSVTVRAGEQATVEPDQPPSPPEPLSTEERRMWATEGEMPQLAPPIGEVDAGMGGNLSIRGVVRDSSGTVAPDVYVAVTVYREGGGGVIGQLWNGDLLTDEAGAYAFNNLLRVEGGHYEVWFNGRQEYGRMYENSGYYIIEEISGDVHLLFEGYRRSHFAYYHDESGDVYSLDVTVHPVTGSAFSGVIRYEDADGATKNYFASPLGPDHRIELNRGTSPADHEYTIGEDFTSDGSKGYLDGLAGGTYYLIFQYRRPDGVWVDRTSPSFEILPGEIKQYDYTIPLDQ
jgi:hypothetical protein